MNTPTLFEWVGGEKAIRTMIDEFYRRATKDALIGPIFADMGAEHPAHVSAFIGEVFGGPPSYSEQHGGHPEMIRHHLGRHLTEAQRRRWATLLLDVYQDSDVPHDPEFASALAGYIEWGSRLAVINSQPGADAAEDAPMPKWGWGETHGPYVKGTT